MAGGWEMATPDRIFLLIAHFHHFLIPPVLQNHTTQPKSYNLTKFNKTMVRA